jgi:archaellum biogenesis protein FlaJ (TadC family)
MNISVRNLSTRIILLCILFSTGMLIASKGLFIHTHLLADGTYVTHAHPYDTSNDTEPYKTHRHHKAELLFIANSDVLFFAVFAIITLSAHINKTKFYPYTRSFSFLFLFFPCRSRAPPAL